MHYHHIDQYTITLQSSMFEPIYTNQNKHYEKATFTHLKYSTISPQYTWITEQCYILYPSSSPNTSPSPSITLLYLFLQT